MKFKKIFFPLFICFLLLIALLLLFYLKGLPYLVSNQNVINYVSNVVKKHTNAELVIENPMLTTEFSPKIKFNVDKISLKKENNELLNIDNFSLALSLKEILSKKIKIEKIVALSIFADVNGIQKLIPSKTSTNKPSDWNIDIFDALLGVRESEIIYNINPDVKIHLKGERIGINNKNKIKRNVYFRLNADVSRKNEHVKLELNDSGNVFFGNNHFYIQDCPLMINNSGIFINLKADKKQNFDITLYSNKLNIKDIVDFLNTQIIENNVQQDVLSYFNDINGNLDFKLNIMNDKINGNFKINEIKFKVKDVNNIPITLNKGIIKLSEKEVKLNDFEGYYDNNKQNKIDFSGSVKDYLKTIDTDIVGNALVRNDFFKKYLTKMTGVNLEIKGEAPTRIMMKSKNGIMDFIWLFRLKPNENIKAGNNYLPFEDTFRLMKADMHLENMELTIKSLDYHMIEKEKLPSKEEMKRRRENKEKPVPIFKLSGNIDIKKGNFVNFAGFEIPQPLPSELLNALFKQNIFKKGTVGGNLFVDNRGKTPVLSGSMYMDKVLIPSLRTFVKSANLNADDNLIHLKAEGGHRRAKFDFNGDVVNEVKFPIIAKNINFSIENIDFLKLLEILNNKPVEDDVIVTDEGVIKADNEQKGFEKGLLIVENCNFHLDKGNYKDIDFANLDAKLTLNNDGIVDIKSNKFDFAQGYSSLKAVFDLVNKKYNVKLGILDADSDKIANALLDLKKEITGKASGFLDLSTDETMKLSGTVKFRILEGTIEKVGLVEYVLKFASLLRNTISMISPAIFADIVNVPDGSFDKITGSINLKNNVATRIKIKTYAPQLSNYIAGRYNIDNGDTSLRVYTKFSGVNKGLAGFLRKISLNSLSNRIPMRSRNDANYYAVELAELPDIEANEKDTQIYLTKFEGDVVNNNYISMLKKIK